MHISPIALLPLGVALFFAGRLSGVRSNQGSPPTIGLQTHSSKPLRVRLYRYELNPDKLNVFDRWIAFERAHHAETVQTLEGERMIVEAVIQDKQRPTELYWIAVDSADDQNPSSALYPIDAEYRALEEQVLKKGSRQVLTPDYVLVPQFIEQAVKAHDFQR